MATDSLAPDALCPNDVASSLVPADLLQKLRDQEASRPLPSPILEAHRTGFKAMWGQPNLRRTDGLLHLPDEADSVLAAFGGSVDGPIVLNHEYLATAGHVRDCCDDKPKGRWGGLTVWGTPGVGKTTYLAFQAALMAEQKKPFLVVRSGDEHAYLWCDAGVFKVSPDFGRYSLLSYLLVLVEPATDASPAVDSRFLNAPGTFTVVAAGMPLASRYRNLERAVNCHFCIMETWGEEEVLAYGYLQDAASRGQLDKTPHSLTEVFESFQAMEDKEFEITLPVDEEDIPPILPAHRKKEMPMHFIEVYNIYGGTIRRIAKYHRKPSADFDYSKIGFDPWRPTGLPSLSEIQRLLRGPTEADYAQDSFWCMFRLAAGFSGSTLNEDASSFQLLTGSRYLRYFSREAITKPSSEYDYLERLLMRMPVYRG
ncbi:hypothetical protein JCM8097_006958 [Rhodosporidiobolus ruineniae]